MKEEDKVFEEFINQKLSEEAEEIEREVDADPEASRLKATGDMRNRLLKSILELEDDNHTLSEIGDQNVEISDELCPDIESVSTEHSEAKNGTVKYKEPGLEESIIDVIDSDEFRKLTDDEKIKLLKQYGYFSKPEKKNVTKLAGSWSAGKKIAAAAAVVVLVAGLGMTSEGTRERMLEFIRGKQNESDTMVMDYGNEEGFEVKYTEEDAYKNIKEILGVRPVRLGYLPEGYEFSKLQFTEGTTIVDMIFENDGKLLIYTIKSSNREESFATAYDTELYDEFMIVIPEVSVTGAYIADEDSDQKKIVINFIHNEITYSLTGAIEKEEIEKIVENFKFN